MISCSPKHDDPNLRSSRHLLDGGPSLFRGRTRSKLSKEGANKGASTEDAFGMGRMQAYRQILVGCPSWPLRTSRHCCPSADRMLRAHGVSDLVRRLLGCQTLGRHSSLSTSFARSLDSATTKRCAAARLDIVIAPGKLATVSAPN